jgi:hypothetical protein
MSIGFISVRSGKFGGINVGCVVPEGNASLIWRVMRWPKAAAHPTVNILFESHRLTEGLHHQWASGSRGIGGAIQRDHQL